MHYTVVFCSIGSKFEYTFVFFLLCFCKLQGERLRKGVYEFVIHYVFGGSLKDSFLHYNFKLNPNPKSNPNPNPKSNPNPNPK